MRSGAKGVGSLIFRVGNPSRVEGKGDLSATGMILKHYAKELEPPLEISYRSRKDGAKNGIVFNSDSVVRWVVENQKMLCDKEF